MDFKPLKGSDIFQCQECGSCCKGFGGTYVSSNDIKKIAGFINIDQETFQKQYLTRSGSRHVLIQGRDGNCIFYNEKEQCTIHPVKPYMCRAWPFIKAVVLHPENWDAMAGSCPGMKKNINDRILKKIVQNEIKLL